MNIFVPLLIGAVDMAKKQQDKIDLLKNRMNRNRTIMDWKHLDKY
jgi:hypothetical protein